MSIQVVQEVAGPFINTGTTANLSMTVTAGNMIHIWLLYNGGSGIWNVSDNLNGTYTGPTIDNFTTSGGNSMQAYTFNNTAGGALTITITTLTTVAFVAWAAIEISGQKNDTLDGSATGAVTPTAPPGNDNVTTGPIVNTSNPALLLAACNDYGTPGGSVAGTGFNSGVLFTNGASNVRSMNMRVTNTFGTAATATVTPNNQDAGITGVMYDEAPNSAKLAWFSTGFSRTGLKLWLKADTGITIATGVSVWADQSGNGNNFSQNTGGNQPTVTSSALNGLPAITFSGSGQFLTNSGFAISGAKHIFWIRKMSVIPVLTSFYSPFNFTTGTNIAVNFYYSKSANYQNVTFFQDNTVTGLSTGSNITADTNWHVDEWTYNGSTNTSPGSYTYFLDHVSQTLANDAGTYVTQTTSISGIGTDIATGNVTGSYFQGSIAEILVYDHVLSSGDEASVVAYLTSRYGI